MDGCQSKRYYKENNDNQQNNDKYNDSYNLTFICKERMAHSDMYSGGTGLT